MFPWARQTQTVNRTPSSLDEMGYIGHKQSVESVCFQAMG